MPSNVHKIESYINDRTLQDLVAAHLQATSIVKDSEDVIDIHIGEANLDGLRAINYTVISPLKLELIKHE